MYNNLSSGIFGLLILLTIFPRSADGFRLEPGNPNFNLHNRTLSYHTLKTRNLVMQGFDLSCGTAVLATIFQYYYGEKIAEKEILNLVITQREDSVKSNLEKPEGLSLFDLKVAAEYYGYRAGGFSVSYENLAQLSGPVIVHLEDDAFGHFAVFKGIREDRIYLADPARGNIRLTSYQFKQKWNGIIFVVEHPSKPPLKNSPLWPG